MPKRNRTAKLDTVQNAHRVFQESIQTTETTVSLSIISQVMAEMGRKGGQIGGKRRLVTMSEEERKRVASQAANKRWDRYRENKAKAEKATAKRKRA